MTSAVNHWIIKNINDRGRLTMNKNGVMKIAGVGLLFLGLAGAAFAIESPEIDVSSGMSALTLLSGILLVIKSRR
ncbi:MAG: hypothetical protein ABSH49_33570 [Bryobacteraceae bacterium]